MVFLVILVAYSLLVFILKKTGILDRYSVSLYGPALLFRTKKGKNFLRKLALKKRFWKAYGSFSVFFCFIMMILFTMLIIWNTWMAFGLLNLSPAEKANLPGPEVALVLPGINPILPLEYLGYIVLALIIAIIVHEFSHGILAIIGKMKVKSLGLLFMIVPVGAFCEPDEEQLKEAETVKRMRVFAAGPLSNFTVAIIVIVILTLLFMPAVTHVEGVDVFYSFEDSPAEEIGLSAGCVITSINDTKVTDLINFREIMDDTNSYQTINITFYRKGQFINKEVELTSIYQYDDSNESYKNISFLGIGFNPYTHLFDYVKNPFINDFPFSFLYLYIMPLSGYVIGYNPITEPFTDAYLIQGPLSALSPDLFWIIFTTLFWIFWLNFLLGLFNILPMVPLDGGYLFKDGFSLFLKKVFKNINDEKTEKISKNIVLVVSLFILFMIISQFFVKYI